MSAIFKTETIRQCLSSQNTSIGNLVQMPKFIHQLVTFTATKTNWFFFWQKYVTNFVSRKLSVGSRTQLGRFSDKTSGNSSLNR